MGARRTTFGKLERDRAKKARAAAKRERRQARAAEPEAVVTGQQPDGEALTAQVLEQLAAIHQQFDEGTLSYQELEERKAGLLGRLTID